MHTILKLSIATFLLFFVTTKAHAKRFDIECTSSKVHAFRSHETVGKSWDTEEKFYNPVWTFNYVYDNLFINNKRAIIVESTPEIITAYISSSSGVANSLWAYTIHLGLKEITAAQVNGSSTGSGKMIKARVVEFNCQFN